MRIWSGMVIADKWDMLEWFINKVLLKLVLGIAGLVVLSFIILPSIAFLLGCLYYAIEAIKIFF